MFQKYNLNVECVDYIIPNLGIIVQISFVSERLFLLVIVCS